MLMKNKFQSKSVPRGTRTIWRYLGALFILFTFAIGNVWAESVTFAATDMSGKTSGVKKESHITALCPTSESDQQAYKPKSAVKYKAISLSSSADTAVIVPASGKSLHFRADAGYKITGISIFAAANKDSICGEPIVMWTGAISKKPAFVGNIEAPSRAGTSDPDPIVVANIPDGTTAFALYRRIKYNSTTGEIGSGSNFGRSEQTWNIFSVTITYEATGGTTPADSYTVKFMDGTTELGTESVKVGSKPTASSINKNKDFYTFEAWQLSGVDKSLTDDSWKSVDKDATVTLTARYSGPNYFTTSVDFEEGGDAAVSGIAAKNIVASNAGSYDAGKASENWAYKGWKIKSNGATVKVLVEANKKLTYKFGYLAATAHVNITDDNITREVTGASKAEGNPLKYTTYSYIKDYDAVYTFTTGSGEAAVIKALSVEAVYTAYFEDEMGVVTTTVVGNVTEVELPTPSVATKDGKNFIGWKANKAVTVDDVVVAANTLIAAGKTAVLSDNTTFTTQWVAPANFDVKFYQGYGDPDVQIGDKQTISTGGHAVAPADPERAGFVFLGWSYDATEAHIVDVAAYGITAATDFTAMWKAVWTVTFDGAGAVNVENGETVASPDSPTQAGKVFQGWYNGEDKFNFATGVTGNLALISKWADANANHFYYNYKDDFHFDGLVYKTPEGKTTNPEADEATLNLTTPYILFSGAEGIEEIKVTNGIYDYKKAADTKHVTSYIKINTGGSSKIEFTIATGYTAVLKMKMGGYSSDPTITLQKGDDVVAATSGEPGGKKASVENNFNEIVYDLEAGTYTMTTATKTLYISHIDLEATALPTYTVTYLPNGGSGPEFVVDVNHYLAGAEVTLMANPFTAPTGKIWSEWSVKDGNDDDVAVTSGKITMPASNVTVTAQWVVDNGMARLYRSDDTEDANSPYATLVEAVAAAQVGDKIVLQRNVVDGAGIMLTKDDHKTLTIDFGGYTYTAVSPGVGSAGTQNQAFHLEKGNTVTLKNGTIACSGSEIKMLIQNYCDLTLENITLDGTGLEGNHRYVMSNNCGDVVIGDGTTITAKAGDVAFDVCATNYYPEGVKVTVEAGATVNGIVEYDVWGTKPADNKAELAIEGGTLNITWNVESALAEDAKTNLNVSGGAFAEVVPLDYCAEGFIPVTEADPNTGKYAVTPGYKVTFIDGSEELEKVAVAEGSAVAEKVVPGKIGYDFDAWYTENTFENAWDFATVVTADMSLYAKWVAFEGCTELWPATSGDALIVGAMVDLQTGSKGGSIKVANLGAAGSISYNANGLSFSNGGKDSVLVTLNNDLKNGSIIKVRLMANGGTKDNGRGLNLLNAARVKKALLGWQANEEVTSGDIREFTYTVVESDGFAGTNVFTLQRQNSVFLQSIKVEECGDAIVYHNLTSAVNIAGKGTVTLGATSVREGYTTTATYSAIDPLYEFVNWTVSGAGASVENATANPATITMGTEDAVVTLNLQLIPVKFTVEYYDGATLMGSEQVAVNENPTASEIVTAKRHYTFLGWSDTDGGDVVALNTITRTEAGTVNLYAKYEPVACPVSGTIFSMEFDETKKPGETVTIAKDASIDLAEYATISGGNAMIINGETSGKDAISTDGEFLLKATKEVMKIELNCVLQEGDIIRIPDNSAKLVISTSNAKTGTYQAFADKNTHEFAVTAAWAGVDDIYVLYDGSSLKFTKVYVIRPAKFDVSFNMMGHGTQIADIEDVLEGSKISAPTAPTDADYSFAGWYKENTLANEWKFDVDVVEANTTLYAKWLDKSDATLKSLKYGAEEIALEAGVYTYNVELPALTTAVPALTAETSNPNATKVITNATAFDGEGHATSTVVVTPEKVGAATQTYIVNFAKAASVALQDVTGSITWDFANAVTANVSITGTPQVLANYAGVTNDNTFESDKLEASGEKFTAGSNANLRANYIRFHTTVPSYSNTGGSNPARYIYVNGVKYDEEGSASTTKKGIDTKVFVPAGDVELVMKDGEDASKNVQIYKMIFNATPDYKRNVSSNYGTLCVEHNVPAGQYLGATFYQIASRNEDYDYKIDFEEVLPNEELKAGEPYLFKSNTGRIDLFYGEETAANPIPVRGMIGNYASSQLEITEENKNTIYYFAQNKLWLCDNLVGSYLILNEHRAYIDLTQVPTYAEYEASKQQQNSAPRRRVSLEMNGEKIATGCENLNVSDKPVKMIINGQLFILRGEKMYDAKGQLVK